MGGKVQVGQRWPAQGPRGRQAGGPAPDAEPEVKGPSVCGAVGPSLSQHVRYPVSAPLKRLHPLGRQCSPAVKTRSHLCQ